MGISEGCYSRIAFNEYGDLVYKPESGQMDVDEFFSKNSVKLPQIEDTCINRLNSLNDYCLKRGATMLVTGYPIAYGEYAEFNEDDFNKFQNELSEKLNCPIISNYTDYFYPYDYFYNTEMHLTAEGAKIRTEQLIDDLMTWTGNN